MSLAVGDTEMNIVNGAIRQSVNIFDPEVQPLVLQHHGPEVGCLFEAGELKTWHFWRAVIAEFVGTFLFLFFTLGTVASSTFWDTNNQLAHARLWEISCVFGGMITILVYAIAPLSGGNLNPAVSVALVLTKKITFVKMFFYIVAQCLGAMCGCVLVYMTNPKGYKNMNGAINSVNTLNGIGTGGAFFAEMVGTSLLVFCVFSAIDVNNHKTDRRNMKQSVAVLVIGGCVTMAHTVLIPLTNCSINPARSFGASAAWAIATGSPSIAFPEHWLFWLAPILGGLFSCLFYEFVFKDR